MNSFRISFRSIIVASLNIVTWRDGLPAKDKTMTKGYWIVSIDVSDPEGYKLYIAENAKAFRKFGARFLVRGAKPEVVEGTARSRNVVIEFKDYATALECYRSPEYAKAMDLRKGKAIADIVIIEGYDGPQPGEP